ncbi:MAG: hypothetical protein KAR00_01640 [Candidatus Pacebacteria bacterium]|nr:hypothetical protein [Candidatus Paceibacterota bacterium]
MTLPKLSNCNPEDVFKMFNGIGGFEIIKDGGKHYGIRHIQTGCKITVPRKKPVNKHLLRQSIIKTFLEEKLGYKEEKIYKHINC